MRTVNDGGEKTGDKINNCVVASQYHLNGNQLQCQLLVPIVCIFALCAYLHCLHICIICMSKYLQCVHIRIGCISTLCAYLHCMHIALSAYLPIYYIICLIYKYKTNIGTNVPLGRRSGGRLATTLVAAINVSFFSFLYFFFSFLFSFLFFFLF